jgi:hypothetical protein
MRAPLLALVCCLPLGACASSPPRADGPPRPASASPAGSSALAGGGAQPRARFVIDAIAPSFERRLADGATLQISRFGRRARVARDGTRELAPDLAPRPLFEVSAAADGSATFLALDGELGHTHAPLGPFGTPVRKSPLASDAKGPFVAGSFGAHAALLATADGELVRVLDDGARTERRKLPLRRGDRVVALAADAQGHAYALILPQRLLSSRDDGETWSDLATPGIGAHTLAKNADDALFFEGAEDAWVALREDPRRFEPAQRPRFTEPSTRALPVERHVAGDRLVTVRDLGPRDGESRRVAISIGSLSAATSGALAATPIALDGGASAISRVVAGGFGGHVVVATSTADGTQTRVVATDDDGRTFAEVATLRGPLGPDAVVSVAPGWLSVGPVGDPGTRTTLVRRGVSNGSKHNGVAYFVADPSRPRLFAFGVRLGSVEGSVSIGRPTDTELGDTSRTVEAGEFAAAGIDPTTGSLRLATRPATRELVLQTIPADGGAIAESTLPVHGALALAGDRGLATSDDATWETADGGKHWTAVGAGGPRVLGCNAEGCALEDGVRVGWDLALGSPGGIDALAATVRAKPPTPPASATASTAPAAPAAKPKLRFACTASGAWARTKGRLPEPDDVALGHDVRFAVDVADDAKSHRVLVAQGSLAPRLVTLGALAPLKSGEVRLSSQRWNDAGVAVASAVGTPSTNAATGASPLSQLDLAWWSSAHGKGSHATIPGPFSVPSRLRGPFAFVAAVDGGAVVMPQRSARLWFARDDGSVESYALAGGYRPDEAFRTGGTLRLVSGLHSSIGDVADVGLVELAKGAVPRTRTWSFGAFVGAFAQGGRLWLDVAAPDDWTRLSATLPVDALVDDPPPVTAIDDVAPFARAPTACSAKSREGERSVDFANDDVGFTVGDLAVRAITRTAPDGSRCVDVIVGSDATTRSIVPLHDLAHGLLLRDLGSDAFEHRPLACVIAK